MDKPLDPNDQSNISSSAGSEEIRVAFLVGFLPIYRIPVLERLAKDVHKLKILLSVKMESDRNWPFVTGSLDTEVTPSITLKRRFRNVNGYKDHSFVHLSPGLFFKLVQLRPRVIFAEGLGVRMLVAVLYRMSHPTCRLVPLAQMSERTERTRRKHHVMLRRFLLRYSDGVVVHGESGIRYIRSLGTFSGPFFTIPYAVDIRHFATDRERSFSGSRRLLYTGQMIERKGIYPFLCRLSSWYGRHPAAEAELLVVGSGPEEARVRSIIFPDNINVRMLPAVGFNELPGLYANADIYLFPTLGDEWGVVVNEALAAGVPVLGSIHGQAVEELIEDGKNGWKFDPLDDSSVERVLERALLASPDELSRMSVAALQAGSILSADEIGGRYAAAVKQLLASGRDSTTKGV